MKKFNLATILTIGTSLSVFYSVSATAANVSTWSGLNTTENIEITDNIVATGSPSVISLNATTDQTIDGHGYSITGANGYSFSINNTANLTLQNLGSVSNGTAEQNTFSFTDTDNETVYKQINTSVNLFPAYFLTRYKTDVALNIDNSVFTNNGGRIVVLTQPTQTLNITNSVFANNSSTQNVAMISGSGIINIEDSIFYNNTNSGDGGVLDISNNNSIVHIKDSYFINTSSNTFGGVINQAAGILRIEGSRFEENSSGKDGGAICLDTNINMVEYIKDSQFINNRNGGSYYDGGAISTTGGYIKTIDNVLFEDNFAVSGGGGLWGGMASKHKAKDPVLIKNTVFLNNEAGSGGGYYSEGSARQNYTYIQNSEFNSNTVTATGHYLSFDIPVGGGMVNTGGVPMNLNNVTFDGNTAVPGGNGDYSGGGGMYFVGGSASYPLEIVDSTFTNNSALEGGGLFVDNADTSIIAATKDVLFDENTALANTDTYNGGSDIYFQSNSYSSTLSLNAANDKKIIFNGTIAAYTVPESTATININNSGVSYNTYDGTTETPVTAGTIGEIQFNNMVGDSENPFTNINLYNGTLTLGENASVYANLNVIGGTLNIANNDVNVTSVEFGADSTLSVFVNSLSDYGHLTADNITVAQGATLRATLAPGLVSDTGSVQLFTAGNTDFNNFQDVFNNNMYHFEKADENGLYNVTLINSGGDIADQTGANGWIADAATNYIDTGNFQNGTVAADIANKLADLAQNDSKELIAAIKALAPMETNAVQGQAIDEVDHLFNNVDSYLRGEREAMGVSAGDELDGVSIWVKPYSGWSKLNKNGQVTGFTTNSYGSLLSIEKKFDKTFKLGAGLQYDKTDLDSTNRDMQIDSLVGFVYGEFKPNNWFINSILSYGNSDYNEDKYTLGTVYKADYDIQTLSAAAMTGYQMNYITPEIGLRYYNIHREKYTDTAMQTVSGIDTNILRAATGVHLTEKFGALQPNIHLGLTYDIIAPEYDHIVNLSNGTRYIVKGKELSRFGFEFDTGLNTQITDNIIFGINYSGVYRQKYQEHNCIIRLKYDF